MHFSWKPELLIIVVLFGFIAFSHHTVYLLFIFLILQYVFLRKEITLCILEMESVNTLFLGIRDSFYVGGRSEIETGCEVEKVAISAPKAMTSIYVLINQFISAS